MKKYIVIPMGEILKGYQVDKIKDAFKRFSCHREIDLENFLNNKAIPYEKANFGKTFLMLDEKELKNGNFVVMAFFTIAQRSINISELSNKRKRNVLGDYPGRDGLGSAPAYLIGQLGRSDEYSNDDLDGQVLLNECYHAISLAAKVVGGNLIVLECREHMFDKFYVQKGFKKLYDDLNDESLYTLYKKIDFTEYWST